MDGQAQSAPRLQPLRLVEAASGGLAVLAGAITLLSAIAVGYVAMYDAPYWDLWQQVNRDDVLNGLFNRHNEHPVVTSRLLFWLDEVLFSGTSRFVQIVSFMELAAQAVLFVWLARMIGAASTNVQLLVVGAIVATFVFYPFGFENTIWIFQVSMVTAFTAAVGGFVCFSSYATHGSKAALAGSMVFSILAVLSLANGVLVPTFLALMAAWLRRPRMGIVFGAIALAGWVWQFSGGGGGAEAGMSLDNVVKIAAHFLAQLGAPIGFAAGYLYKINGPVFDNVLVATAAGAPILALALFALAYVAFRRRRDPAALAAAAIILFALATAALVAVARYSHGLEQALSSRYNINAAILYSGTLIVLLGALPEMPAALRKGLAWLSPVLAVGLVIMSVTSPPMLQDLAGRYRTGLAGLVSLVAGARDEWAVGQLSFSYDLAVGETARFREKNTWMFADPIARRMGETLSSEESSAPACTDSSWTVTAPHEVRQFRQADGRLARQSLSAGASHVLITDASGLIVGYGRVPRRISDLNPLAQNDGRPIDWIGRVSPNRQLPLFAWLGDSHKIRCALGGGAG